MHRMSENPPPEPVAGAVRPARLLRLAATWAVTACACVGAASCSHDPGPVADHWNVLSHYCYDCHNSVDRTAGLAFDEMSPKNVGKKAAIWEKALRKLRGGLMPPPGGPRPTESERAGLMASLEKRLGAEAAARGPHPGYVGLHRLNRTEYGNAVRDLLGVQVDTTALLPRDNSKDGYDNIASVLTVSPTFLEQYVAAARSVAKQAVGDAHAAPGATTYINHDSGGYKRHVEGLPLGTRGGMAVTHDFPANGQYRMNIADMAQALWVYDMEFKNTVLVTIDGREVYRTAIGGDADQKAIDQHGVSAVDRINQRLKNIRFTAPAGPHRVAVTFLARTYAESDSRLASQAPGGGQDRLLRVKSFDIQGPFDVNGVGETPSRRKIFTCHPESGAAPDSAKACARRIIARLARRAYRRPVTDADMHDLLEFYARGMQAGGFDAGIRKAITAILASPEFLYRFVSPKDALPGSDYTLNDFELASRLSFFIWSSIPDDELLDAAAQGRLHEPKVLKAEVKRMLADKRARSLVTDFAFQWLDIARLDQIQPDRKVFPDAAAVDPRAAYKRELQLFLRGILLGDHSVVDLLTSKYTYVNETVARMYGIDGVRGDQFRRVKLADSARWGLLGKGAILMATSYPNRTTPVLRGKFVLAKIMGSPPSPPPAGVVTDLPENKAGHPKTVRERLAAHRSNPSCNTCHGVMDPLGLTLENFNAIGQWRERDKFAGTEIDASGQLATGQKLDGPDDLREALASKPERFVRTLTEQLMTFALGRSLTYYDMPVVRRIVDDSARDGYRFSSLVLGIVNSDAFRMIQVPGGGEERVSANTDGPSAGGAAAIQPGVANVHQ